MNLNDIIDSNFTGIFNHSQKVMVKHLMRESARKALEQAIKSFPSHEHPEIAKAIMNVMGGIE